MDMQDYCNICCMHTIYTYEFFIQLCGVITRLNLTHDFLHKCLHKQQQAAIELQ